MDLNLTGATLPDFIPSSTQVAFEDSSDCSTISSSSLCSPSSSTTDAYKDEDSFISESDSDSLTSKHIENVNRNSGHRKKRRRAAPPPIFFGTPCKAEHERIAKYETKMRTRRLLRKDSLDLARRKSIGNERGVESEGKGTRAMDEECKNVNEKETGLEKEVHLVDGCAVLALSDSSMLSLPEGFFDTSQVEQSEPGTWTDKENSDDSESTTEGEEEGDENEESPACDRTIRVVNDSTRNQEDEEQLSPGEESPSDKLPSTPVKQIAKPTLYRPSLSLSDAESSPGIPLAPHSASTRPSPLVSASPLDFQNVSFTRSPYGPDHSNFSPIKGIAQDHIELPEFDQASRVLKESPRKANLSTSPTKIIRSSSPSKVVVRQTLSAWAHAKLKTPQSPEKKEWDLLQGERMSPIRSTVTVPLSDGASERTEAKPTANQSLSVKAAPEQVFRVPSQNVVGNGKLIKVAPQGQLARPPSRIARPVPISRLPKPTVKPVLAKPNVPVNRTSTSTNSQPIRHFANSTLSSASRTAGSAAAAAAPLSRSVASRQAVPTTRVLPTSGPFRGNSGMKRSTDHVVVGRTPFNSSSPSKEEKNRPIQRAMVLSSSPVKRPISTVPIVRDARLISALPKANESVAAPLPSPVVKKSEAQRIPAPVKASNGVRPASKQTVLVTRNAKEKPTMSTATGEDRLDPEKSARVAVGSDTMGEKATADSQQQIDQDRNVSPATTSDSFENQKVVNPPKSEPSLSQGRESRHPRRVHQEKHAIVKTAKATLPSSVFPPSSTSLLVSSTIPLSKVELSKLTSSHTRRNETFVSQLETIVIRKRGEKRPASPSSKIRRSVASGSNLSLSAATTTTKEAAKEARERRARKRTPEIGDVGEEEEEEGRLCGESEIQYHRMGAGEDQIYSSPPRSHSVTSGKNRTVRWHKSLFCGPSDTQASNSHVQLDYIAEPNMLQQMPKKSCLSSSCKSIILDKLGNVADANQPWSPRLGKNRVTVYKVIYDDDE